MSELTGSLEWYRVTIQREANQWVARDNKGTRRAWGKYDPNIELRNVPKYLFHADEIRDSKVISDTVEVTIYEY